MGHIPAYDNIYDITSPTDRAKSVDFPQNVVETPNSKSVFTHPELYGWDGENDYVTNVKLDKDYQHRDPETESQFPDLSIDKERPNKAPRQAYLADVTPHSHTNTEEVEPESQLQLESGKAYPEDAQPATIPDPTIEIIAKSIVARYNLEHSPIQLDVESNVKVAISIQELVDATSTFSVKNEPRCNANFKLVRKKLNRYNIHVSCGEEWSDPSGHIIRLKFLKTRNIKNALDTNVLISCSCPFWRYYGCDWNSLHKDYNERQMSNGAAPKVRGQDHLVCKHVAASIPLIKYLLVRKR